jgi:hypothetical protein
MTSALSSGRINPLKRSCNYRTKLFLELRFGNKGKETYQAAGWEDGASTDGLSWPGTDSRRCYVSSTTIAAHASGRTVNQNPLAFAQSLLIDEFRKRTPRHEALLADLETALTANADFLGLKKPVS